MTAPQADAATIAGLAAYQQATSRLRGQLSAFLAALWRSLGYYRNAQMVQFIAQAVPVVAGAQQQMASLTSAYLATDRAAVLRVQHRPVAVDPAKVTGAAVRNGVSPQVVYGRPFHLVWRQLGDGVAPGQAIQAGLDRAEQSALTDLQLAKTHTAARVMAADPRVVGYRRVLEGAYSCALCVIASTQRYHQAALMPIHSNCDCSQQPIYGGHDPGLVIDEAQLESAHQQIAAATGTSDRGGRSTDYRSLLITHDHGELGPVLAIRGRPFTGPAQLAS